MVDLGNIAGSPMLAGNPRSFRLLGLPRTPQQKRGFVRQHSTKNWKHNLSNFSLQRKSRKEKTSHQKRGPAHGSYSFLNSLCTCSSEITWLSPLQSFYLFRAPPITCVSGERGVHFQPCLVGLLCGIVLHSIWGNGFPWIWSYASNHNFNNWMINRRRARLTNPKTMPRICSMLQLISPTNIGFPFYWMFPSTVGVILDMQSVYMGFKHPIY